MKRVMDDATLKISLAGLIHDIGKFAQAGLEVTPGYLNANAGEYQPYDDRHKRHTHIHAIYTAAFIEQLADLLPPQFNLGAWDEGDSFINLAAGHHNPRTPMQWLIAIADRISSGFDRDSFEEGKSIAPARFLTTRLLPLLESLHDDPEKQKEYISADRYRWRYPLARLAPETIFPEPHQKLDREPAANDYRRLFNEFRHELSTLPHRRENPELWGQHFDSLLMLYTSLIPAARAGDVVYDVSLYDHSRTTAALAAALYLYHRDTGTLDERAIRDSRPEKFRLVTGDFYGIQDFIFTAGGASGRYRAKLLRGRSFQVTLLTELAAARICRVLGLPETSVLLKAAGKFTILAPNTPAATESVTACAREINDWLFNISCGQCGIGISSLPAAPADFTGPGFAALWDRLNEQVAARKLDRLDLDRHGGVVDGFLESFDPELGVCDLCGRRPAEKTFDRDRDLSGENKVHACDICRDQVFLGGGLVKNDYLAILAGEAPGCASGEKLSRPLFGEFQLIFPRDAMPESAARKELVAYWNLGSAATTGKSLGATLRPCKGYVPTFAESDGENRVVDFAEIAAAACGAPAPGSGTSALGVFKADIDNLGLLLSCGLPEDRLTISRLATLSRQLNNFFTIFLPSLLHRKEPYRKIYTIFAGGDDLFLIGPWNRTIELAAELRQHFSAYACENPDLHFSAGITLQKPHVPVDKLADAAEAALEEAKSCSDEKNRLTLFGETVTWAELDRLIAIGRRMEDWLQKRYLNPALLYRLGRLCLEAGRAKEFCIRLKRHETVGLEALRAFKWRSQLSYTLERNAGRELDSDGRQKARNELVILGEWLDEFDRALKIPIWRILYDLR